MVIEQRCLFKVGAAGTVGAVGRMSAIGLLLLTSVGCRTPYYADRGATTGGLAGAGIGALIGEANDEPLAGAAIGTVVGAATGALLGNQVDDRIASGGCSDCGGPTPYVTDSPNAIQDVITMTSAGLSDDVIIAHLHTNGAAGPLQASDLIMLKQQCVSDNVIRVMQQHAFGPTGPVAHASYHEPYAPVVFQPTVHIPLRRGGPPCHGRRPPRCRSRSGVGISLEL